MMNRITINDRFDTQTLLISWNRG